MATDERVTAGLFASTSPACGDSMMRRAVSLPRGAFTAAARGTAYAAEADMQLDPLLASTGATHGNHGSTLRAGGRDDEDDEVGDATSDISSQYTSHCVGKLADFELQGIIGSGKFSTVYRAQQRGCPDVVALKKVQIFEIMDSKMRNDCINEVKLLQSLDHPNIIRYLASFMEQNELVIVLEWAEQGDLSKVLREGAAAAQPLPELLVWRYFVQIAGAVRHMHARRMMHRDIKPSNVLVGRGGELKLGDLGLGRYFSSKTDAAQSLVGTPYYMSPECIRGLPYAWASDVWSLGCLLYELAALKGPFYRDGLNYYTLGKSICACSYEPLPDSVGPELRSLVAAMITADPAARPDVDTIYGLAQAGARRAAKEAGLEDEVDDMTMG